MYWPAAARFLAQEAQALLTRLQRVRSFALTMPMVPAAGISLPASAAIESYLSRERRRLEAELADFLDWLAGPGPEGSPAAAQRRFTLLRLRFHQVLSQFDIFADVINQRSEHDTGVWLAGLDAVAADALELPGDYYEAPPVMCYLDRGIGAAIRRARTRLPGGGRNPVAIIRVPRERMIGSGIASSLVHEVGHQATALLDLMASLRPVFGGLQRIQGPWRLAWQIWERWLSEILADFWSVARVGIAAPLGLLAVVSLPRAFVFRIALDDPHPCPYLRVKLSCAFGRQLYPHPQWDRLRRLWESFYPLAGVDPGKQRLLDLLEKTMPALTTLIIHHRPPKLQGRSLQEVLQVAARQPARLLACWRASRRNPGLWSEIPPSLAFAIIGQAKAVGWLDAAGESRLLDRLLRHWALKKTLDTAAVSAALGKPRGLALAA